MAGSALFKVKLRVRSPSATFKETLSVVRGQGEEQNPSSWCGNGEKELGTSTTGFP